MSLLVSTSESPPQSTRIPICILSMHFTKACERTNLTDVVPLQFVDMSNSHVPPYCAIPPIQPQTCIFNALTNMVEELKGLIKVQTNLSSYKTVPFPTVWSGFISELVNLGTLQANPPHGQIVYHICARSFTRAMATGIGYMETGLHTHCYGLDGTRLFTVPDKLKFTECVCPF